MGDLREGKLRVLSLFAGIGGFDIGLERAGMKTVAFCEISPKPQHLLKTHWPDVPCFEDVSTLTGDQVGPVDVICGGFPCQDISLAGKGAGLAGERSGLWSEYARLVRELRPSFVIVENVSALLGRGLGDVLRDLAALGYDAWWDCIPAAAVGAPHRRDRLWVVAYARGQQHEDFGDALRREIAAGLLETPVADTPRAMRQRGRPCASVDAVDQSADGSQPLANSVRDNVKGLIAGISNQEVWSRSVGGPAGSRGDGLGWWSAEPDVGRVAHGVPARMDRLHGLGNAVVPQIPEIIGRAILSARADQQRKAA